jgi:hypothetical protein
MTEPLLIWIGTLLSIILMSYGIATQSDIAYIGYGILIGSVASAVKFKGGQ